MEINEPCIAGAYLARHAESGQAIGRIKTHNNNNNMEIKGNKN
jgi:hypothetical protein